MKSFFRCAYCGTVVSLEVFDSDSDYLPEDADFCPFCGSTHFDLMSSEEAQEYGNI